jgi:DNA polymerase III alpha subunit
MPEPSPLDLVVVLEAQLGSGTLDERAARTVLSQPLPLRNGAAAAYLARRSGDEPFLSRSPAARAETACANAARRILGPTFGLLLYREQILALAREVARFEPAELRRLWIATTNLQAAEAADLGQAFVARRANTWTRAEAEQLWSLIVDAAPVVMAAGEVYRAAARTIAEERLNDLWPLQLHTPASLGG